MQDIFLCGLKHSGKSRIGQYIARQWGCHWVDADDLTKLRIPPPLSIRSYYRRYGQEAFQKLERESMEDFLASNHPSTLISMGGGSVDNPGLLQTCAAHGQLVYLSVPEEILYLRIIREGIPPFLDAADPKGSFHQIYLRRDELYGKVCKIVLHLPDSPTVEQTAAWCIAQLEGHDDGTQQFRH